MFILDDIIGAVGSVIGGAIGNLLAQGKRDQAEKLYKQSLEHIKTEQLDPELMKGITPDHTAREAQLSALNGFWEDTKNGGLGPEDMLAIRQAQDESSRHARGQREALDMLAQERNTFGSGNQYVGAQIASQEGANRASEQGMQAAAAASARRRASMAALGSLGTSIRGETFGEDNSNREAQYKLQEFNARNRSDVDKQLYQADRSEADRLSGAADRQSSDWAKAGGAVAGAFNVLGGQHQDAPTQGPTQQPQPSSDHSYSPYGPYAGGYQSQPTQADRSATNGDYTFDSNGHYKTPWTQEDW